jgi:glycosyltransferase involved in cell wall biosynthesis
LSAALRTVHESPPGGRAATDTLPAPVRGLTPITPGQAEGRQRESGWPQHLVVFTDAWHPQVNGVVQTWTYMRRELAALGLPATIVSADAPSIPVPGEPGLRLALRPGRQVRTAIEALRSTQAGSATALHIATEGPIGWAARRWALRHGLRFTTSFHTRFPEYFERRFAVPARWTYPAVRSFHAPAEAVLVPTQAMIETLQSKGFERVRLWPRGVDSTTFAPHAASAANAQDARGALERAAGRALPQPIFLSVGRVAPEKNLDAFLRLDLPGSKVMIGDGPALPGLRRRFPRAVWLGAHAHASLGPLYAAADVFVFPSRTDTFGLVMLEAMACGTPVAAFPVTGPLDVVEPGVTGVLDHDLKGACMAALQLPRERVRAAAAPQAWRDCAITLGNALVPQRLPD